MGQRNDLCSELNHPDLFTYLFMQTFITSKKKLLLLDTEAVYANLNIHKTMALELLFKETKITF